MAPAGFAPLYDRCHFAIASLGLHRIGIDVASTLKTREYLAKGMPFVYSGEVDVFRDEPAHFCMAVPADETPVDVAALATREARAVHLMRLLRATNCTEAGNELSPQAESESWGLAVRDMCGKRTIEKGWK